jgi:hypothetical protein
MITKPEQFAALTEAQKYERLIRAELQRDNAELYARELNAREAQREVAGEQRTLAA